VPDAPGPIVTWEGKKLGTHRGLHLYTLGQRKGLGVASNTYQHAYVVVEKRGATRELVVALESADAPHLFASRCLVRSLSWVGRPPTFPQSMQAQPRYRCPGQDATVQRHDETTVEVIFDRPQRALAPGQICAFYAENELLGGGVFEKIFY
jgi:tRNA-uridine 2-sulfurtransferase